MLLTEESLQQLETPLLELIGSLGVARPAKPPGVKSEEVAHADDADSVAGPGEEARQGISYDSPLVVESPAPGALHGQLVHRRLPPSDSVSFQLQHAYL